MGYEGKSEKSTRGRERARGGGRRRKKGDRGRERASEIKAATAEGQWRGTTRVTATAWRGKWGASGRRGRKEIKRLREDERRPMAGQHDAESPTAVTPHHGRASAQHPTIRRRNRAEASSGNAHVRPSLRRGHDTAPFFPQCSPVEVPRREGAMQI